MTIREARASFRKKLSESDNAFVRQTPALDVDVLICHLLGRTRTWLLCHDDEELPAPQADVLSAMVEQRLTGLPVAYLTHEKEFFGRRFYVDQRVLIPKPDTELLVELAVAAAGRMTETRRAACRSRPQDAAPLTIADVCTGSGCIAISVLLELAASLQAVVPGKAGCGAAGNGAGSACTGPAPAVRVTATDLSPHALEVARKNVGLLVPDTLQTAISLSEGDLCAPLGDGSRFDLILSNPPYVPHDVTDELLSDGRGEPRLALDGDTDAAACPQPAAAYTLTEAGAAPQADPLSDAAGAPDAHPLSGAARPQPASDDGLAVFRRLAPQVFAHLAPGGVFLVETGEYNAEAAAAILAECGFTHIHIHRDLSGQLRVTEACRPETSCQ